MTSQQQPAETAFTYVDGGQAVADVLQSLAAAERAAIDTEADSLHHYYEKVCLLQMTIGRRNFVLDPLGELDLSAVLAALADKTLILHGADYDLRMLRNSFGFRPRGRVIDTMIAAQLLGYEKFGLAALVERFFGYPVSKAGQKSDWSHRPLSGAQLRYAVDDTRFLAPLADRLLAELERLGRRRWLEESSAAATAATAKDREFDAEQLWRIRGVRELTPRQAAFVRELWFWRDREAQRADRPPFKIIGNNEMLTLALWAEAHPNAGFEAAPRLPRHFHRRRLGSLRETIQKAAAMKAEQWPDPKPRRRDRSPVPGKMFEQLREAVSCVAAELHLQPSVLAPRAAIEEISRCRAITPDEIRKATGLLPWQAELIAPDIRRVWTGK